MQLPCSNELWVYSPFHTFQLRLENCPYSSVVERVTRKPRFVVANGTDHDEVDGSIPSVGNLIKFFLNPGSPRHYVYGAIFILKRSMFLALKAFRGLTDLCL